jgi:hypothetical protein
MARMGYIAKRRGGNSRGHYGSYVGELLYFSGRVIVRAYNFRVFGKGGLE